jgi:hypothetical protein
VDSTVLSFAISSLDCPHEIKARRFNPNREPVLETLRLPAVLIAMSDWVVHRRYPVEM